MTTVLDALQKGTGYLEKHGVDSPRLTMQMLLAHLLKCGRMQLYVDFDRPLGEPELAQLRDWMRARAQGCPVQHILGKVEFFGHEFACDQRALIPRPETEHLVDLLAKQSWPAKVRILDMGCGSGVIGLSLAIALRHLEPQVTLVDRSPDALALARENAATLAAELAGATLHWVESDLFGRVEGRFDLLAANLPYISSRDMEKLSREVQRDPAQALLGGEQGTEIVERFLDQARAFAEPDSLAALEIGYDQAATLRERALQLGWASVELKRDLEGKERFLLVSMRKVG